LAADIYGLSVVTRNVDDFAATGLDLINPWES
jgi:predicted nucleic acid-binding protein